MTEPTPAKPKGCGTQLAIAGAALLLLIGGGLGWRHLSNERAIEAQAQKAEETFGPAMDKLAEQSQIQGPQGPAYDIDKTIRVIHEIDQAMLNSDSLEEWLGRLSRQDYRGVAPEVLQARTEVLDVLKRLYAAQVGMEDQQALWDFSSSLVLLSTLSVVDAEASLNPLTVGGSFDVDKDQARGLLDDMVARQEEYGELQKQLRLVQSDLLNVTTGYSEVWYRYVEEWDKLTTVRDRAYLAAWNGDWDTAIQASEQAIAQAPLEREARLLKAWASIESGRTDLPEGAERVRGELEEYLDEHPERSAPALLMLGVLEARAGNNKEARLRLQQAATDYPKQATQLSDMLDPYRSRSYLRKSREGGYILDLYQSTMLGAGTFSPDLQLAKMLFEAGDREGGREKVFDHFARRRAQQQWDALLTDLVFCEQLLGADYRQIFPDDFYLDLVVEPAVFGSSLNVKVHNRSDRALHNATLVLALQFTDMHPSDYQTFIAGETQPAVSPHALTDFGGTPIEFSLYGMDKGVDDIVTHRAILVSNEAVVWVDTDEFKLADAQEQRHEARAKAGQSAPKPQASKRATETVSDWSRTVARQVAEVVPDRSSLSINQTFMKDEVTVQLPKELALLRPLFQLRYGGQDFKAEENIIVGEDIQLTFKGVGDFEDPTGTDLGLVASTPFGELEMSWVLLADGSAHLKDVGVRGF